MDALRISPKYTSGDWDVLDLNTPEDWPKAADIVSDRLDGRFLGFASKCLRFKYPGFVVLAIDSLLAETIQQFKDGVTNTHGKSEKLVKLFLTGNRFQPDFDAAARKAFYQDIRCGLLHRAEAKKMWLIRRKQSVLLRRVGSGHDYIIDVERFHAGVQGSLNDYLEALINPASSSLRSNLWRKMDQICSARKARGALYEAV